LLIEQQNRLLRDDLIYLKRAHWRRRRSVKRQRKAPFIRNATKRNCDL